MLFFITYIQIFTHQPCTRTDAGNADNILRRFPVPGRGGQFARVLPGRRFLQGNRQFRRGRLCAVPRRVQRWDRFRS